MITIPTEDVLRPELDSNERLLWSGQPLGGIRLTRQDTFLIPFSILWCGFVVFWEASAVASGAPFFFMLFGLPFVGVGIFILFGRFFFDKRRRENTVYGLTDQRIIIIGGAFNKQIQSIQLRGLSDISIDERSDGSGTITLGPQSPMNWVFAQSSWPGASRYGSPALERVERAREVYQRIRQAQKGS